MPTKHINYRLGTRQVALGLIKQQNVNTEYGHQKGNAHVAEDLPGNVHFPLRVDIVTIDFL